MSSTYRVEFEGPNGCAPQVQEAHTPGQAAEKAVDAISDDYRMPADVCRVQELNDQGEPEEGRPARRFKVTPRMIYEAEELP